MRTITWTGLCRKSKTLSVLDRAKRAKRYRYTRNPMYVGFLLTLLAWAVFLANPLALLWVAVYVLYITRFQTFQKNVCWRLYLGQSTRLTQRGYADGYEPSSAVISGRLRLLICDQVRLVSPALNRNTMPRTTVVRTSRLG